ncbi:C40 family peptidase, partial [Clostridium tertium]
ASKVGGQYIWGHTGPSTFDCSGLTQYSYKQAGITIPRTSKEQSTFGKSISKENLQVGDLLFFCTNKSGSVSHVGIYEGNGVMIHASSPKNGIKRDKLTSSYYFKNGIWKGARRVV